MRGQECPKPVIRVLRILAVRGVSRLEVLVDSPDCAETIKYMVESLAVGKADYRREDGHYRVEVVKG